MPTSFKYRATSRQQLQNYNKNMNQLIDLQTTVVC